MKRRTFLASAGAAIATGLAGCNTVTEDSEETSNTDTDGGDEEETTQSNRNVEITTQKQPGQLPSVWNNHNIEDFQAQLSVQASEQPDSITVSNENVEINRGSEQWNDNNVTVQPGQMNSGEQEFTATAQWESQQAQDTTQAAKATPGNYKIDVVPERNEELRSTISENSDEENYVEDRGGFVTSDPVLDTYSSHEQLGFDKFGVDLAALEWHHDNDYEVIEEASPGETAAFIDIIGNDTGNETVEKFKSGEQAYAWYPSTRGNGDQWGHWDYEVFENADTLGTALDHVHPLLFNFQFFMSEDGGPISSEDEAYAPMLEQAIEQKNNGVQEVHAWDVGLSGATHGNGLIYGKNADGSEELRIMETIRDPVTTDRGHTEWHPLVENSGYITPGNEGYEATHSYWHPLRFGWEGHEGDWQGFRDRKEQAVGMARQMTSTANYSELPTDGEWNIAPTTEYISDFTEKLRTFNQNNVDFEKLYNQAKIMHEMQKDDDANHVIYGDTDNPQYAVVEDDDIFEEIWNDQDGQYDDFNQFLRDNPSYSMSTEEINASLEGEMSDDFGQQALAGA